MLLLMTLALQAAQPQATPPAMPAMPVVPGPPVRAATPEAERLGLEIAQNGMLAGLLPLVAQKDVNDLIADNPSLTPAEQAQLRATGQRLFDAGRDRLMRATGHAYAQRMSVADLRRVVAFYRTPAARALQEATPAAMIETMQTVAGVDLKRDIRAAFCRDTGKLCGQD